MVIEETVRRGKPMFVSDADARDATVYRLQTLAESTQRLSDEFKAAHPEIPWSDIAGFRDRAVHGYLGVKPDLVWDIAENELPQLAKCVRESWRFEAATAVTVAMTRVLASACDSTSTEYLERSADNRSCL